MRATRCSRHMSSATRGKQIQIVVKENIPPQREDNSVIVRWLISQKSPAPKCPDQAKPLPTWTSGRTVETRKPCKTGSKSVPIYVWTEARKQPLISECHTLGSWAPVPVWGTGLAAWRCSEGLAGWSFSVPRVGQLSARSWGLVFSPCRSYGRWKNFKSKSKAKSKSKSKSQSKWKWKSKWKYIFVSWTGSWVVSQPKPPTYPYSYWVPISATPPPPPPQPPSNLAG